MLGRYEDTRSSGSSGRREAIRALSRAPSNSSFTMSSQGSHENDSLPLPRRRQLASRFDRPQASLSNRPQKPRIMSDKSSVPQGLTMLREQAERDETYHSQRTDTQQSNFDIPHVPGYTELINGTYEDGTPVFSSRTRPSRFQRTTSQQANSRLSQRNDVEAVNVPVEEQAIVLSLKVLRDRLGQLEKDAVNRECYIRELEQKNSEWEREASSSRRLRRSDSAVGLSDEDSDDSHHSNRGERNLTIHNNRESSNHSL